MCDDVLSDAVVRKKRQPHVAVTEENQPRLSGSDEHVTADVEFSPFDQQRIGDVPEKREEARKNERCKSAWIRLTLQITGLHSDVSRKLYRGFD